jgi:hypothetical protein
MDQASAPTAEDRYRAFLRSRWPSRTSSLAVKVNVRWLAEPPADQADAAERSEALADTLAAVERIGRIVADLRRQAAAHDPDAEGPPCS